MTNDKMDLQALVGKSPDADFLRDMIGFAVTRLMELEVGALTGASYGEKDVERLAQRNGYRDRDWETRGGSASMTENHSSPIAKSAWPWSPSLATAPP
jgi:putative transposase